MVKEISLRKNMVEELIKEIRGPRFGVNEVISFDPWSEYLSGLVISQKWIGNSDNSASSPDEEDILEIDDGLSEDSSSENNIISNNHIISTADNSSAF